MIGQDEIATARPMAKAIKSLVNEGVFAVVVMGTAKAHRFFEVDPELNTRKTADINLDPVNLNVPSERSYFFKFIGQDRSADGAQQHRRSEGGPHQGFSGAERWSTTCLEVSSETSSQILQIALRLAHRDNRRSIEWKDIEAGYYSWKTTQIDENGKPIEIYDPFAEGPKARTLEAVKDLG